MKAYKGFDKELICRGYQFEVGKTYEEEEAELCKRGFHACENPIDVFAYYPPRDSRYCEVELDELSDEAGDDSKRCGRKIHIVAEISLSELVNRGVKFILDREGQDDINSASASDQSTAANTGDYSMATSTGYQSTASVEGKNSVALVTGANGRVRGTLGCAIALCEYDKDGQLIKLHSAMVDGVNILPDTWYTLVNGEFSVV